jgi:hypothetical protein
MKHALPEMNLRHMQTPIKKCELNLSTVIL